ncbi:hypothetical protein BC826DRAFT_78764 [Russula brevipes]|nr:hypothetical protein BC826DRAFT_78764 [Russula brevipes]
MSTGINDVGSASRRPCDTTERERARTPQERCARICFQAQLNCGAAYPKMVDMSCAFARTRFQLSPHHAKVALPALKVLIPLPDIIADRLQVCHRAMSPQGIALPRPE